MANDTNSEKFTIDIIGETTGKPWKGVFETKLRLSHREFLRQDMIRRELIGPVPQGTAPSPRATNTAELLSFAQIHLKTVPQWWSMNGDGLDFEDDNVIGAVYEKIVEVKLQKVKEAKEKAEADKAVLEKDAAKAE